MKENFRRVLFFAAALCLLTALVVAGIGQAQMEEPLTPIEQLGSFLYFDENLSEPDGQSCASCHDPNVGFDDPDVGLPVSEGVIPGLFGGRNSPISAYAMYAPIPYFDNVEGLWIGGQFWDGRATGDYLGDPLADQAIGPFLNSVEMANTSPSQVIDDIKASEYSALFEKVWGEGSLEDVDAAYDQVGLSIAAFERTALFGQFSSKYDYYLETCIGMGGVMHECAKGEGLVAADAGAQVLAKKEWQGLLLFMGENDNDGILEEGEGAMCSACHVADWTSITDYSLPVQSPDWAPVGWVPPIFTDFTFDNLGIPKSEDKLLADAPIDLGLGPIVFDSAENGKFKVMTVRNIGLSAPYGHNGFFKHLKDIVHFYNTRDVPEMGWAAPEYPDTINFDELGNLGLNDKQEDLLVKFMMTLSDGYVP